MIERLISRQFWIGCAEIVDAWRLFPRLFVGGYGWLAWDMHEWITRLPDISTQQAAYSTAIIGLCVPLVGWYMQTGRKWQ